MGPLSKLVACACLSTEIFVRLELVTADGASLTMPQSARGDVGQRAAGQSTECRAGEMKIGEEGHFWIHIADLHPSGRGMVCLSSAMQINLPEAAMAEEVKKHTRGKMF